MIKVDMETAEQDFEKFVGILRLSPLKLEKLKDDKDELIELIKFGYLEIGPRAEEGEDQIVYNLEAPLVKGTEEVKNVIFKQRRLTVGEMEKFTGSAKSDLEMARRMLSALIGLNSSLFLSMDAEDFTNLGKISAFFLPR